MEQQRIKDFSKPAELSCENIIEAQRGNKEGDTLSANEMLPPNLCSKKLH